MAVMEWSGMNCPTCKQPVTYVWDNYNGEQQVYECPTPQACGRYAVHRLSSLFIKRKRRAGCEVATEQEG